MHLIEAVLLIALIGALSLVIARRNNELAAWIAHRLRDMPNHDQEEK